MWGGLQTRLASPIQPRDVWAARGRSEMFQFCWHMGARCLRAAGPLWPPGDVERLHDEYHCMEFGRRGVWRMGTLRLHDACNCQMHDRWYEAEKGIHEFRICEFISEGPGN